MYIFFSKILYFLNNTFLRETVRFWQLGLKKRPGDSWEIFFDLTKLSPLFSQREVPIKIYFFKWCKIFFFLPQILRYFHVRTYRNFIFYFLEFYGIIFIIWWEFLFCFTWQNLFWWKILKLGFLRTKVEFWPKF